MGSLPRSAAGPLAALVALLSMSMTALAQQPQEARPLTTTPDRPDAVRVWVTGNMVVEYIHRAASMTCFTDSFSNPSGLGSGASDAENTFEGEIGVRVTAEMMNKVTVVIEFGTRRADGPPNGTQSGINRFGAGEAIRLRLREGNVHFAGVIVPEVSVEAGISTWAFNIRGKGGAFAFDPRHSQTLIRNLDSDGPLNVRDNARSRFAEAAFTEMSQPVGATATYTAGTVVLELVALPTVAQEGGAVATDDQLYAIDLLFGLDSVGPGSRAGLIAAISTAENLLSGHAVIYTFGGGTSLKIMEGLELYGEGYVQMGQAGVLPIGRVSASGRAAELGAEWHYTAGNPLPFWLAANFTHITGNHSDDPNSRRTSRFAAYSGVSDLMILEDPYYGFDWDSNYQAFKIYGGASFNLATDKHDLDVMAILGIAKATSRVVVFTGGPGNKLGDEVDLKATWHVTKQVALKASIAYLWGCSLLDQAMRMAGNPIPLDHTWLALLGWDLVF